MFFFFKIVSLICFSLLSIHLFNFILFPFLLFFFLFLFFLFLFLFLVGAQHLFFFGPHSFTSSCNFSICFFFTISEHISFQKINFSAVSGVPFLISFFFFSSFSFLGWTKSDFFWPQRGHDFLQYFSQKYYVFEPSREGLPLRGIFSFFSFVFFKFVIFFEKYFPKCSLFFCFSKDVSSVVGAPWRCGVLTTQSGIAGIGLGHLLGREHDSTPQSGVEALLAC